MSFPLRAVLAWVCILVLAILNGALREGILIPRLGDKVGHVLSTLLLSAIVLIATWIIWPFIRATSRRDAWFVGVVWVLLTLAFEFLAGHYLFGNSWEKLTADYNVMRGRIWILVLITTLLAPVVAQRFRT